MKMDEPKDVLNIIFFQRRENRKNTRGRRPSGTSRARRSRSNAAMKALTSTLAACCRTTCKIIDERSRGPRFEIKRDHKKAGLKPDRADGGLREEEFDRGRYTRKTYKYRNKLDRFHKTVPGLWLHRLQTLLNSCARRRTKISIISFAAAPRRGRS